MIQIGDAQTIAAIASEFMTDSRYGAWYEREKESRSGTPGIWSDLGSVAEKELGLDWACYQFMDTIFVIVDHMYEGGLEQDWTEVLREIVASQKED
jgi:hypothetical protein